MCECFFSKHYQMPIRHARPHPPHQARPPTSQGDTEQSTEGLGVELCTTSHAPLSMLDPGARALTANVVVVGL